MLQREQKESNKRIWSKIVGPLNSSFVAKIPEGKTTNNYLTRSGQFSNIYLYLLTYGCAHKARRPW